MSAAKTTLDLVEGITDFSKRSTIKDSLERFGEVTALWLPPVGHRTGRMKEAAYVKFRTETAAEDCMNACKRGEVILWDLTIRAKWRAENPNQSKPEDSREFDARGGGKLMSARDMYLEALATGKGKTRMSKRVNQKKSSSSSSSSSRRGKKRRKSRSRGRKQKNRRSRSRRGGGRGAPAPGSGEPLAIEDKGGERHHKDDDEPVQVQATDEDRDKLRRLGREWEIRNPPVTRRRPERRDSRPRERSPPRDYRREERKAPRRDSRSPHRGGGDGDRGRQSTRDAPRDEDWRNSRDGGGDDGRRGSTKEDVREEPPPPEEDNSGVDLEAIAKALLAAAATNSSVGSATVEDAASKALLSAAGQGHRSNWS